MSWRTFIDISKWQGTVNFATMRNSGVDALYIRAFQGVNRDSRVDEYAAGANSHGIPFGIYIYWRPGHPYDRQISQFVDTHRDLGASLIPMLDIEHDDGQPSDEIGRQVTRAVADIERLLNVTPVIYTAAWFWNPRVTGTDVSRCPLWLARYTRDKPPVDPADWPTFATARPEPAIPSGGWSSWDAWQFSADGNHAGPTYGASSSHLDLNILRGESWGRFQTRRPIPDPPPLDKHEEIDMRMVTPVRVYDSRNVGRHAPGETRRIKIDEVSAVFVNLTVVGADGDGYLTAWAASTGQPDVSNVNYSAGQTIANTSWVPVAGGAIDIFTSASCDVLVDVQAVA